MAQKVNDRIRQERLAKLAYQIFDLAKQERSFLIIISLLALVCAIVYPYPQIAMWTGFALAGYSAIANDSIQTIGTFIASNSARKWWYLWLFIGLIFVLTVTYSWWFNGGDVSYGRLQAKGFAQSPTSFSFLQLAAPLVLLILTRMRMPVSTTFLILNAFATEKKAIISVLSKSLSGYFLAFFTALIVWLLVSFFVKKYIKGKPAKYWTFVQWVTSGILWAAWIKQDAANIAIFLPRSLSLVEFLAFTGFVFLGLGLLFYLKGDKIQKVVNEKSGVTDVRAATFVDLVYAVLLYYKLFESNIPMSTTWIFIGLLGGRELAISLTKKRAKKRRKSLVRSLKMIGKDMGYALIGLVVSLILAIAINDHVREQLLESFF